MDCIDKPQSYMIYNNEQFAPNWISVDLLKRGQTQDYYAASDNRFLAKIHNKVATFTDHESCRVELRKTDKAVILTDFCGGTPDEQGTYMLMP